MDESVHQSLSNNTGVNTMIKKTLLTASLLLPLIAVSGAAYAGPQWNPTAALANGTNGYTVGDTWIEPTVQQQGISAFASAAVQRPVKHFTVQEKAMFDRASGSGQTW
jgi:hypothetical protein